MGLDFDTAFDPFRALKHAWAGMQREPAPVLVAGFLLVIMDSCQGGGGNFQPPTGGSEFDEAMAAMVAMMALVGCCLGLVVLLARAFIEPGAYRVGERITMDGASGLDTLFSGKDVWLSTLGYMFLQGLIGVGVFMVTALPGGLILGLAFLQADGGEPSMPLVLAGALAIVVLCVPTLIYTTLGLQLGRVIIALDRVTAMEALERSWALARGNRIRLFIFNFVCGLTIFVGLMMCCVGMIPARGLVVFATANAYLLHARDDFERFALVQELGAS